MNSPTTKNSAIVFMALSLPFLLLSAYFYVVTVFEKPDEADAAFGYHLFYGMINDYLGFAQFFLILGLVVLNAGAVLWAMAWLAELKRCQQTNKIFP
jgi:hypothetical protein